MRKVLILLLFTLLVAAAAAQTPKKVKYLGEFSIGYSFGQGIYDMDRVTTRTVNGIKVKKYFSTGIGVGIDFLRDYNYEYYIPVYLNLKGYLPVSNRLDLFVSLDGGGYLETTADSPFGQGWMLTPSAGIQLKAGRIGLFLSVGYEMLFLQAHNQNAIGLNFGLSF